MTSFKFPQLPERALTGLRLPLCYFAPILTPYNVTDTFARSLLVSRWDRLLVFGGLNLAALALFVTCFVLLPTGIFVLRPSKFVIL